MRSGDARAFEDNLAGIERKLEWRTGETALSAEQRREIAASQQRAQPVYDVLSEGMPTLRPGEKPFPFRVRIAQRLQRHSPEWAREDLAAVARSDPSAFGVIEQQIYDTAQRRGLDPTYALDGGLRARKVVDQSGVETTIYHGDIANWINQFAAPTKVTVRKFWDGRRRQIYPK
jgi:hypothetical protein